jgi:hypothetical protein
VITNSLEWNKLETQLKHRIKNLNHSKDVSMMIKNINQEIKKLSNAEINVRCGHKDAAEKLLIKINQDIEIVEEYILVATLLG